MYKFFLKRFFDIFFSFIFICLLSPLFLVLIIIGALVLKGNPFFTQLRPGKMNKKGKEKIFRMLKFRSMSNDKDENGVLLPDEQRLGKYGKFLRSTSLDELPQLFNIFIGDMSFIGPRPQLIKDMVFMSEEQRKRHKVRPGLSGLAQVNGRNQISWEEKFDFDLKYFSKVSFFGDIGIIFKTIFKVLKREQTVRDGTVSDLDYGDWLLKEGKIDKEFYDLKQKEAFDISEKQKNA